MSSPHPTVGSGSVPTAAGFIRPVTLAVGVVFLAVGVLGFVPGITTHYDSLTWWGHHSDAKLIGLFQVSVLHNVVHLAFGLVGLLMARTVASSTAYLIAGGAVYLVLWVYGLVIDRASGANFVPLNTADNWLHLVLAIAMIGLGALAAAAVRRTR